jgi:hypothetical protein
MSKSDENPAGSIFLLDDADTITKKIKRAVTDSGTEINFDETRPAIKNLLTIYQLLTGKTPNECVAHFNGKGYGQFKTELAEATVEFLKPFQQRVKEYDDDSLNEILKAGADKARGIAAETLKDVYARIGNDLAFHSAGPFMYRIAALGFCCFIGCSVGTIPKTPVSNRKTHQTSRADPRPALINCGDPAGYDVVEVKDPKRVVNVISQNNVVRTVDIPSGSDV